MPDMQQRSPLSGAAADSAAATGGAPGFDRILDQLRGVVERLEAGSLGLEESLSAFEEGVRLSRRGAEILDSAERRVELLLRGAEGAPDRLSAFPASPPASDSRDRGAGSGPDPDPLHVP